MKLSKVLKTTAVIAGTSYVSYKAIANKIFNTIFNNRSDISFIFDDKKEFVKRIHEEKKKAHEWLESIEYSDVSIKSFDGLRLQARKISVNNTNKYIILVHGWHGDGDSMLLRAKQFIELGFNCLVIDQRASGYSQGEYFTFGFKESIDLIQWAKYLEDTIKNVSICFYGISMGAATCLMTTRFTLPKCVKAIVEDCGFSSLDFTLSKFIENKFNIKYSKPVLTIIDNLIKEKLNFSLYDLNTLDCLENCKIPLLIIHGDKDEIVPFECSKLIYHGCKSSKKYWATKNRKHAESFFEKKYYLNIQKFLNENMQ